MFLDGLEILWDLKILRELAFRRAKFCEILSHSVRYGIYENNLYTMYKELKSIRNNKLAEPPEVPVNDEYNDEGWWIPLLEEKSSSLYSSLTGTSGGSASLLFLIQNICCGYSKEPSRRDGSFEHPKHMFNLMGKKIIAILRYKNLLHWTHDTFVGRDIHQYQVPPVVPPAYYFSSKTYVVGTQKNRLNERVL